MKYRCDFVTNSSSSSFLLEKKDLDNDQLNAIRNNGEMGVALGLEWANEAWSVDENDDYISCYTWMDNYDISELLDIIGVKGHITWSESPMSLIPRNSYSDNTCDGEELKDSNKRNWRDILNNL